MGLPLMALKNQQEGLKLYHLTNDETQEHLNKEEIIKKAAKEAKLLEMSKLKLIKVVHEEAEKAGIDPKILASAKGGRKDLINMWTTSSKLRPEPITDVKIHTNTKPAVITVYRGTNIRTFEVHNSFKFTDFRVTELGELGPIIQKKKNKIVSELMTSLGKSLPEGVPFMNNMVIEEPEYEMFFIDVFGDHAFQRMSDINNFGVETLITYLVMASNITTLENGRFCLKLRKLIANHPDQEKLKSKKVKLESPGYKLD
ncbi:hypothetical protein Tco_1208788 [Tanacetum coccineum]